MTVHSPPRASRRRHLRLPLKVEICADGRCEEAEWAINVSPGGMGLQARTPRKLGERVTVRFRLLPDDPPVELEAEVVWCGAEPDLLPGMDYYELGVRFPDLPSDVRAAIDRFVEEDDFFGPEGDPSWRD